LIDNRAEAVGQLGNVLVAEAVHAGFVDDHVELQVEHVSRVAVLRAVEGLVAVLLRRGGRPLQVFRHGGHRGVRGDVPDEGGRVRRHRLNNHPRRPVPAVQAQRHLVPPINEAERLQRIRPVQEGLLHVRGPRPPIVGAHVRRKRRVDGVDGRPAHREHLAPDQVGVGCGHHEDAVVESVELEGQRAPVQHPLRSEEARVSGPHGRQVQQPEEGQHSLIAGLGG
jgi:hypothetical protein